MAGIAIDGQMAGILGVGRDGLAVTPYDSWLDTRCAPYIHRMREAAGERIVRRLRRPALLQPRPEDPVVDARAAAGLPLHPRLRAAGRLRGDAAVRPGRDAGLPGHHLPALLRVRRLGARRLGRGAVPRVRAGPGQAAPHRRPPPGGGRAGPRRWPPAAGWPPARPWWPAAGTRPPPSWPAGPPGRGSAWTWPGPPRCSPPRRPPSCRTPPTRCSAAAAPPSRGCGTRTPTSTAAG